VTAPSAAPIGAYRPPRIATIDAPSADPALVERLRGVAGLSSAFSDELDALGIRTAVPASELPPLREADVVVGRALTLRYLPMRTVVGESRLAHLTVCEVAQPGDVLVISSPRGSRESVMGGKAAAATVAAGVVGIVVDGAVRDLDEIEPTGLAAWARVRTPITGRGRLDAVEINGAIEIGGVAVQPGDIVVADRSGVVFVPSDLFVELAEAIADQGS
jgi:4-hydroxy-4-methyl-2-oxoglutarate aldolase